MAQATLIELINKHAKAARWLALPAAELWPDEHARQSRVVRDTWAEITDRFPEHIAKLNRNAAWRIERERLIRGDGDISDADAILDRPLKEFWPVVPQRAAA